MYCYKCGRQLADDDPDLNFCPKCGKALPGISAVNASSQPLQWEFKDAVIPLGVRQSLSDGAWIGCKDGLRRSNEIILEYLQRAGQEGWEAEGITTFGHPSFAGRLAIKDSGIFTTTRTYESVTIRLKRLVRE